MAGRENGVRADDDGTGDGSSLLVLAIVGGSRRPWLTAVKPLLWPRHQHHHQPTYALTTPPLGHPSVVIVLR